MSFTFGHTHPGIVATTSTPPLGCGYVEMNDQLNVVYIHYITVNVDIFAWMNFRGFTKMGSFAWNKIRVLRINGSLGYHKSYFHGVHIFADI